MKSEDDHVHLTASNLVEDWILTNNTFSTQTANTMRSALLWGIEQEKRYDWESAKAKLASIPPRSMFEKRTELENEQVDFRMKRQSGRMIPEEHFTRLVNGLSGRGVSGIRAQYLLLAGVATGARPIEWTDAAWADKEKTILRIYTAKVKARNAWTKIPPMTFSAEDLDDEMGQSWTPPNGMTPIEHPDYHDIDFERRIASLNLSEDERDELRQAKYLNGVTLFRDVPVPPQSRNYVDTQIIYVAEALQAAREKAQIKVTLKKPMPEDDELFEVGYYAQTRSTIWRTCIKVFSEEGILYSPVDTRSTFSANRKAEVGVAVASKEMGHAGVTTTKDFYAPASKAWKGMKHVPSDAEPSDRKDVQNESHDKELH